MTEPTVVYIAGYGRSGSTLLDLMLGSRAGWFSMGEFRQFWHALRDDWRCGCGAEVASCDVWSEVVQRAAPGAVDTMLADLRETVRVRRVPALLAPGLLGDHERAHARLTDCLARVYRAIPEVTGAHVLVDSSKDPIYGLLLAQALEGRFHVVHLVRDSRAVAWSWQRRRVRPEIATHDAYMPTRAPWKTSLDWDLRNALAHVLGRQATGYTRLTYESLVAQPHAAIDAIARALNEPTGCVATAVGDGVNHTVGGNPMRFDRGAQSIAADAEWDDAFLGRDRRLVTALTWPLLRAYEYPPKADTPPGAHEW
jgi:hypothetical protein